MYWKIQWWHKLALFASQPQSFGTSRALLSLVLSRAYSNLKLLRRSYHSLFPLLPRMHVCTCQSKSRCRGWMLGPLLHFRLLSFLIEKLLHWNSVNLREEILQKWIWGFCLMANWIWVNSVRKIVKRIESKISKFVQPRGEETVSSEFFWTPFPPWDLHTYTYNTHIYVQATEQWEAGEGQMLVRLSSSCCVLKMTGLEMICMASLLVGNQEWTRWEERGVKALKCIRRLRKASQSHSQEAWDYHEQHLGC